MYQNKIKLTPQEILEKSFKIDTRGYRLKEVDQFLDDIITDYEQFYRIINSIEQDKNDLIAENMRLKQELRNARMNVEIVKKNDAPEVTNVDIIRRLSRLEKMVYGSSKTERTSLNSSSYEENDFREE
ncbi:MAG: cell division regulator GpsB [Bacilli bacterium]|nr:cell division regulator GpsB [Bacilli bacterium]